ncbi:MAG: hypothetical protein JSV84_09075 [Gemmatimonadota bacterium]|nr:MAG: hypothetical protein JSV84_09075 [Gemmatimonadota bacterium]
MWKLIKGEFFYNKNMLLVCYTIFIALLITFVYFPGRNLEQPPAAKWLIAAIWQIFIVSIVVWAFYASGSVKNRRARFQTMLPVSILQVSLIRFVLPLFFWSSGVCLFWIMHLLGSTSKSVIDVFWTMLCLMGVFLIIVSLRYIAIDLKTSLIAKNVKWFVRNMAGGILLGIIFIVYFFTIYTYYSIRPFHALRQYSPSFLLTPSVAVLWTVIGVMLTFASIVVFSCRQSYVES